MIFHTSKNILLIILGIFLLAVPVTGCSETVKEPAVAGSFYPADKEKLIKMVDGFLSKAATNPVNGKLIALLAPHAGYIYSGPIAGHAYKQLMNRDIETVILMGPSHHEAFKGVSVYEKGKMKTPLGMIKIDDKITRALINKEADVTFYPEAFEKEHSLEVQLPFIQRVFKQVKIVPVLIGAPTRKSFDFLTDKITGIMRDNDKVIIIASTDLSHFHDYDTAVKMDMKIIDAVERMSANDTEKYLMTGEGGMCGGYPVLYTMAIARNLGATNGVLYKYANSGDVTGDRTRVVGYAAIGLYNSPLSASEKTELLGFAKETITSYVKNGQIPEININDKRLRANGATFVTIKTGKGMLRGCMGNIQPDMPLYESVISNAVNACSRDPRFHPMREEDLDNAEFEVTVLSPFEPLNDTNKIEIGRHGLYIVKDNHSGILLPQVPVEFGWDRETFLKQVSKKAGLPEDAWKEAKLFRFTAEIIK
ncbi:MAG: AmmeMemoRadiSam system protein B [Nitrospirae bacterium]|nr:AmmeMemoRadiSam system protein B [Nitrospirota bacterium]